MRGIYRVRGRAQSGSALVMALILMALLVALAVAASAMVRVRLRSARGGLASVQRLYLAQSAIRFAESALRRDETAPDSLDEEWSTLGDKGNTVYRVGTGWFRFEIVDAASRVNLNTATKETLMKLPGVDDALSDAILDWRESGTTARPAGAKEDYYLSLSPPYSPRGGPFESVAELLLVRGVTPLLLYGLPLESADGEPATSDLPLSELVTVLSEEPNVTPNGDARTNLNTAQATELVQASAGALTQDQADAIVQYRRQRQYASIADILSVPGIGVNQVQSLADKVTTTTETTLPGRVNVNTASEQVLAMLPGMTEETAAAIVSARDSETQGFESIGDLLTPGPLSTEEWRQAAPSLCTRSSVFLVRAMGRVPEAPGVTALEALVERTDQSTRVIRMAQVARAPGWIAWGWSRQVTDPDSSDTQRWW